MKKIAFILALSISTLALGCASTQSHQGSWISWPSNAQMNADVQTAITHMAAGDLKKADELLTPSLRETDTAAAFLHAEIQALQGQLNSAVQSYTAFVANHPDHSLASAALVRLRMLSDSHADLLDWDAVSKLRVSEPYAKAQLIVLQNRSMRNTANAVQLTHPTAIPLVHWHWMGPFTPYVQTGFTSEQPFDHDQTLAEHYEVNGKLLEQFQYTPENVTAMAAMIPGLYAAETYLQTSKKHTLQLTVHGAQLYTILIDGTPILTRDSSDFGQEAVLSSTFDLPAGEHIVRLKLGLTPSAGNNRQIALWLSPVEDKEESTQKTLADITELNQLEGASASNPIKNIHRLDTSSVLGETTTTVPEEPFKTWTAAIFAIAAGKVQTADALIQARLAQNPDDQIASYLNALRYRKDADLDESVRNEKSMNILRDVSENAPQIAIAHQILMTEFIKQSQPKQALSIWEKHANDLPANDAYTALIISQLTSALSWSEISNEYTQIAASLAPNSCRLNKALLELQNLNHIYPAFDSLSERLQACPQIIRHYAKLDGNDPAAHTAQNADFWTQKLRKLASDYPAEAALQIEAIKAIASSSPDVAIAELTQLLTPLNNTYLLHPTLSSTAILEIVDTLRAAGKTSEAEIILKKAIDFMPSEANLQYMYIKNQNTRLFEDLRIDGMQTIQDYLAQNREDPGNSVMILDYAATKIMPDGSKIGLTHQISRVLTKEGKNAAGEIYLPQSAALLKVRTIKDGTFEIFEPESIDYKNSITAPNLAVGDYIETEYLTFDNPASLVSPRTVTDTFFFGAEMVPLVRSEYVVDYPKDWDIQIVQSGPENEIQFNCTPNDDFIRCIAKRENIPPFISSSHSDTLFDLIPNIQFSYQYDWDFIRKALSETITRQTRVTPYLKRYYDQIGIPEGESTWEHARAIYDFVISNIDESEYTTTENETATSTVTRGVGSRLLAIKALYDIAGFSSYLALRRTFGAPSKADELPALYNSTHELMLVVDTEKGPAYVQPDEDYMPFDYLDPTAQNQTVIPIDPAKQPFTSRVDDPESARSNINIEYAINPDGTASASSTELIQGTRSIIMRNFLNMVKNDPDMAKQVIQNSLAQNYGRIKLTMLENENFEDKNQPLTLKYAFDIAQFAETSGDELSILARIFAYNLVNQHAAKSPSEQKTATYIVDSKLSRRMLTFHAPAGYHWQTETLNDIDIDTPFGKYSRHTVASDNTLELTEAIQLLPQRVDPSNYEAFRNFCLAVDEAQRSVLSAIK